MVKRTWLFEATIAVTVETDEDYPDADMADAMHVADNLYPETSDNELSYPNHDALFVGSPRPIGEYTG